MSASPPEKGAEQGDATPDNNSESMDRGEEVQQREAYDFEVKEQDRWLPIANGWFYEIPHALFSSYGLRVFVLRRCMMMARPYCRRLQEVARAMIVGFPLHSLKIYPSISFLKSLWSRNTMLSGHLQCPEIPRIQYLLHRAVQDLTALLQMLI